MKVAIVHDDLVQWGGAERVLLGISEMFPEAPIYTSVFDRKNSALNKHFGSREIKTSFMQKIPFWRGLYRVLLPLYPIAFEQFDFTEYDLVISQTTKFAKAVITKPETVHVSYCHTPPRFLWGFSGSGDYPLLKPYFKFLKKYDRISAKRVDYFLAGSKNAQKRIEDVYGMSSEVLYPFTEGVREQVFDGGYYLMIARLNKYKRVDVAVGAFGQNGRRLKIVGVGPEMGNLQKAARSNIEFLGAVSDELLANLLAGCRALIVCGEEDFGLSPLEAGLNGKPVLAYRAGGVLETIEEGVNGVFFDEQSPGSLNEALEKLDQLNLDPGNCRREAEKFSKGRFQKTLHDKLKKYYVF